MGLCEQQGNSFHETIYEFREGLVATCVDHLVNSSDQLASDDAMVLPDVSLVFERCIGILKAFLAACNAERNDGASRPEIHGALDEDAMLTIKINSNLPLFQLSVHPSGTLGSLRRMVAARFGCSEPDEIRLFSLGKDFVPSWDARTLEELHVDNNQSFLVNKRPHSMTMNRPQHAPKQVSVPTDLLLKPEFFERVRHIFLLDEKYASQAWEVVVRLPTSPVLLHSLEDLQEDVEWTTVLDARTPFLLLYSLQIVNALIKRDQCSEDPDKQTWVKRFLSLGGQQYLTTLLMSESGLGAAKSSPTARKALALMLKVLVRLTYFADIESIMATDSDELTIPAFLNKLVQEILTSATCEGGDSPNDQSIVLNATNLISYLCEGPGGWHYFHTGPDIRSLIYVSMVQSDSMQIRQTVLDMGRKFCQQAGDIPSSDTLPVMFFLEILQSFLPIDKEYESNCSELFEFFETVARQVGATEYCSEDYYRTLYERLIQTIMNHPSSEDTSFSKEDTVLIGTLKVATAMISTDPRLKQLDTEFMTIDYILDECLFPQTSSGGMIPKTVKCQSDGSRFAAFSFLEESARGEPDILRHVIMKTRKHFERESELEDQWGYDPQMIKKANCGFVGLQNLGATCYVNSIIQQFFMNREFRLGILDAPVDRDDPGKHDTLLYQLQALFSNLQGSIKRAYNAHGFCYAYKDWDGNPMNVAVQMDVDEFFNILFDRLENSVKDTPQEYLFKQQYGGKLVQQIKSKDCEHISEREDSFFSIQCEVKNKKTLEESLQLYVQGEILDGDNKYKCSSCDKHVDAIKRACIKELPRNLILHLKRFDYDMDTMRRIKINDRFEFPTRLDMEPYTLDYLTRKEQAQDGNGASPTTYIGGQENSLNSQYNLVGVLVHTGTADSGHYYSYIKDRSTSSGSGSLLRDNERPRWYLFNDSKVEEFDPNDIPIKAFGGSEYIPQDSSPYMKTPPRSTTKPYSAYMLFYERADHKTSSLQALVRKDVPADIKDNMVKENTTLLKDLAVFDRLCYRFVWTLFNLYKTCPQVTESDDMEQEDEDEYRPTNSLDYLSMQYGLDFFFSILIHARDVDQELQQWTRFLSSLLAQYPKGCATFLRNLSAKQALLYNVLLSCPITQVREAVVELLVEALRGLREQDKVEYGLVSSAASESGRDDSSWMCVHGSLIHRLIRVLLQLLPEARASWRNFDEYFKLIYNITQLGRAERVLMVQEGYIAELVEFYTSDERTDIKRKKMGDKFTKPSFRHLLLAVQEILTVCDIKRSYEALQNQVRAQHAVHGPVGSQAHRKSSGSSSSTSSVLSSPSSDEAVAVGDIHIANAPQELEQTVLLSNVDFNALFACYGPPSAADKPITLISKMIQDRIDSAIIASIVIHLSTHDAIGTRLLETLSVYMEYANEDQFTTIMQIFKELVQIVDGQIEGRVEFILVQILKVLEQSPQPSVAYDCLDFFRTISDYGQCGRFAQSWLLRHSKTWLQELLFMQAETDTRVRARLFYMELLSSERAFNGWNDEQAAAASGQHFSRLLELLKSVSGFAAYPSHVRRDEEEGGWRFVEYFKALTELVKSEGERNKFVQYWSLFIEILTKLDSQQLNLDYDKKEMMVFWNRLLTFEDVERDVVLAKFKPIGNLLRKFYVCLQHNPTNVQFHQEILPIYFGLVLRFSKLEPTFHMEWAQCHNFTWALQAMKWGLFTQHCPEELNQLLQYTLTEIPQYRPFAEAMDHWSNIDTAIELLVGNLMWTAPPRVYAMSIKILDLIVKEATFSQSAPILAKLTKAQYYLREAFEDGKLNDGQLQGMFGGTNSPFCQYGVLESHQNHSGMGSPLMRIGPLIFMHPSLYLSLEAEAAQRVLQEWFMPYWELARSACLLDGGGSEHSEMAIELAALMAMEQLTVGSLMHAEILWEAAVDVANSGDLVSLLQHRIVGLYMEKLLNRERYLGTLTEHLNACGALLKASNLSETIVSTALEEGLSQAEKILNRREEPSSSPLDNMPLGEQELSEKQVEDLITALQNLVILGVDVKGEQDESVRLRQVHEAVRVSLSRVPESYRQILSDLVQSDAEEAASDAMVVSAGDGEVAPVATKFVHGPGEDTSAIVSPEEDPTVMTGIIEDSASGEGKAM
ncbi:hypothetical protein BGX34_001374 [Mortierella sp. NVP85]|nr:hypothetical protein BGX34_001374 [Mortierella sp. NVP85]